MSMDDLLTKIGGFGVFQRRVVFLLCLVSLPEVVHRLEYLFWASTPEFSCIIPAKYKQGDPSQSTIDQGNNASNRSKRDIIVGLDDDSETVALKDYRCFMHVLKEMDETEAKASEAKDENGHSLLPTPSIPGHPHGSIPSTEKPRREREGGGDEKVLLPCENWEYNTTLHGDTIVSKWNLVCSRKPLVTWVSISYSIGQALGSILFGILSDSYGRRKMLILTTFGQVVTSILLAVAPEIYSFLCLRALLAVFNAGQVNTAFIIVFELVGHAWRILGATLVFASRPLGTFLLVALATSIQNHVTLQLVTSIPLGLLLTYVWVIPESPRWLVLKHVEAARCLIRKIAHCNGVQTQEDLVLFSFEDEEVYGQWKPLLLCKLPSMRKKLLVVMYLWFTAWITSASTWKDRANELGSSQVALAVFAGLDLAALLVCCGAFYRLGRRFPVSFSFVLVGVLLECTPPLPSELHMVTTSMVLFSRFAVTVASAEVYIYAAELFPTALRGTALGACFSLGVIAEVIGPKVLVLDAYHLALPHVILGGLCLTAALIVLFLPDTNREPLPDTISDGEYAAKRQNLLCFVIEERSPNLSESRLTISQTDGRPRMRNDVPRRLSVPCRTQRERPRRKSMPESWDYLLANAAL